MINPLTAPTPVPPIEPSPYYPSSRRFVNPLYLRVEDVPGWQNLDAGYRERVGQAGRALNEGRRIDRTAIFELKMEALEAIFATFPGETGFDWYRGGQGQALIDFATYCAIAEKHGKDWRAWPAALRRPDSPDVAAFRAEHARRVDFHAWLQWRLDTPDGAGGRRDSAGQRPADRAGRGGRGRVVLAGSDGARRVRGRAARTSSTPRGRTGG